MCHCEDRPCCGHLAEERGDAYYAADYYDPYDNYGGNDFSDWEDYEPEERDPEDCDHADTDAGSCIYCGAVIFADDPDDAGDWLIFEQDYEEPDPYAGTYSEE